MPVMEGFMIVGREDASMKADAEFHFDWAQWWACAADANAARLDGVEALQARQRRRLQDLVDSALLAPHHRARLGTRPPDGWRLDALPVFRKRDLMAHFDACVTDPGVRLADLQAFVADPALIGTPFRDRYAVWHSSGSSGEPGMFVTDAHALAVYDALESTRRPCRRPLARAMDPLLAGERVALVGAVDGHFAAIASFQRLRRINPWLRPRLHAVSLLQPRQALNAALDRIRPTVLFTYPSAAVVLADELRGGRLRSRPCEIWTGGETLTPAMRRFVSDTFECPVGSEYGASECLPLGTECRLGALHLNADWAILECVDAGGRRVPDGTRGARCLLTNLANHVQPLIRYELEDRVTIAPARCACGCAMPVIEVVGRSDDVLRLGTGSEAGPALSPMALTTVLEDAAGLVDFQLLQIGPRHLELRCPHDAPCDLRALRRGRAVLLDYLHAQQSGAVEVTLRSGRAPIFEPSGKFKRVRGLSAGRARPMTAGRSAPT